MGLLDWFSPSPRTVRIGGFTFEISYGTDGTDSNCQIDLPSIPAISSAIEIKANDVSQIPLQVFLRTANGRQRMRGSALDDLLTARPNPFQNAASFWKTVAQQATVGECFISIRGGRLDIFPFGYGYRYVTPAGLVRYARVYTPDEKQVAGITQTGPVLKEDYAYGEVLHLWNFQDEDGLPHALRDRFRRHLNLASDTVKYQTRLYNRGGTIAGYLSTDAKVNDEQKKTIIQAFKSLFKSAAVSSSEGANPSVSALDNGWKWNKVDLTPQEMMMAEARKDLRLDFAQIMNMPPWKLGDTADYHYATAESAQREYLQVCLNPLLNLIESEINCKMIPEALRGQMYVEFARDALISIDAKTMAEIDNMAVMNGGMSTDEWRERRNLPHDGQNMRLVPVNVTSADFVARNEAIKIQAAELDLELKRAELAAKASPPAGQPVTDFANSLRSAQDAILAAMPTPERWTAETMRSVIHDAGKEIARMHGLPWDNLATFANRYLDSADRRAPKGSPQQEANRAVNALNHEAMKLRYGITAKAKWIGGSMDGQVRSITETIQGNFRHPPIDDNFDCFLIPA